MRSENSIWRTPKAPKSAASNCARSRSCWRNDVRGPSRSVPNKPMFRSPTHCKQLQRNKGTVSMATKELPINADQDGIPQSLSKNFDQTGNSSGFIFDVSLSTAIAADGKLEAQAPLPKGPLSPEMLYKMSRYLRGAD